MTAFTYDVTFAPLAPTRDELEAAFDADRHARASAAEVCDRLTPAQWAGVDPLLPGDEYLLDEAESRSEALEVLLGLRVERRRVVVKALADDWRSSVTAVDWSKGRTS